MFYQVSYGTFQTTRQSEDDTVSLLRAACYAARSTNQELEHKRELVLKWLCRTLSEPGSREEPNGKRPCPTSVAYHPIGRLGNIMGLYAIIYSLTLKYGVSGYVEKNMWNTLKEVFPHISLKESDLLDVDWEKISYQQVEERIPCKTEEDYSNKRYFWIDNYPDRNGIDLFHPFYNMIQKEFEFSSTLKQQSQQFLTNARGNRTSATFIGFHIRRTDYKDYIRRNYNMSVPEDIYYNKCLDYYRRRFKDALFIVCSDEMEYVRSVFKSSQSHPDVVLAGNGIIDSPARDMALLAACNHSIVTVGTYGFWGAYLAGGTVLTPEKQTHQSRGDRHTPLLEIQLAGADNWIAIS